MEDKKNQKFPENGKNKHVLTSSNYVMKSYLISFFPTMECWRNEPL